MQVEYIPKDIKKTDYHCPSSSTLSPRILIVRVTESCNAKCFMCAFAGNHSPHLLTQEIAQRLKTELSDSQIRHIRFTGGEPLLLEDIDQLIAIFKSVGLVVSIITNGMMLYDRCSDLVAAGLDQVIVSIDSPYPHMHDKLRKINGLHLAALAGINRIRSESPMTRVRVNSVVGHYNLAYLPEMFVLLHSLGVMQWSLIPLKPFPKNFPKHFEHTWFAVRQQLLDLMESLDSPKLMGTSIDLFGGDPESHRRIISKGYPTTPRDSCNLVNQVRYLDLATHQIFPCNCVPHRGSQATMLGEEWNRDSWQEAALGTARQWLKKNGPLQCEGCEPINVALGEGFVNLYDDLYAF